MATLFSAAIVLSAAARVLPLDEAVHTALAHQPQLRQARASTEAARAVSDEVRAPLLPQVAATAGYERATANFMFRPGVPAGASAGRGSSSTTYNFFSSGLTVSQLLFDFGQTSQRWRAQQASAEATGELEFSFTQQLELTVRATFFGARANRALVGVAQETVANLRRHLDQTHGFVTAGTRPPIDFFQTPPHPAPPPGGFSHRPDNQFPSHAPLHPAHGGAE